LYSGVGFVIAQPESTEKLGGTKRGFTSAVPESIVAQKQSVGCPHLTCCYGAII